MNKQLHRLVFNKARGLLMAVSETAASHGKGAGSRSAPTVAPRATWNFKLHPLSMAVLLLVAGTVVLVPYAEAQIVGDPAAAASLRPTIINAANGVPLVNIQTPSAAGVSRNLYTQFDVQNNGVILNNARTNTATQLGGWVQGNPNLAGGTARVILNEVNSSNPSYLRGYVEVGGDRAQVVIANPSGVTCDGCGFINANRATLTTGTPILNGGALDGYRVQGGRIVIQGHGLDASGTDYTDLIARSVQVNSGIWANTLKITAGANQVNADNSLATPIAGTGAAPAFAIDVAQLGGMYAGKIMLVGTEAGVGVRNAGQVGASAGEVRISIDGLLTNSGVMNSSGQTVIDTTAGIANSGTIYANGNNSLTTQGNVDNSGTIAALGNTTVIANGVGSQINNGSGALIAAGVNAKGIFAGGGALTLSATQAIASHGSNLSTGEQWMTADTLDLSDSQSQARHLTLLGRRGDVDLSRASIVVSETFNATAAGVLRHDQAQTSAARLVLAAHDLSNVEGELIQTGRGDLVINLPGNLDNRLGRIATNSQNVSLTAQTITNTDGRIDHAGSGTLSLNATTFTGTSGKIYANGLLNLSVTGALNLDLAETIAQQLSVSADSLSHHGGRLIQTGNAATTINIQGILDNTDGTLGSNGSTRISAGNIVNQGGSILAASGADLLLSTGGLVDNRNGGSIAAANNATVNAGQLVNDQGRITANGALTFNITDLLDNRNGTLLANQDVDIHSWRLNNNSGSIASMTQQALINTSGSSSNDQGRIEAAGNIDLSSSGLSNIQGTLIGTDVRLRTGTQALDNDRGTIAAYGWLDISSGNLNNHAGLIQSVGNLSIDTHGQTLSNTQSGSTGGILSQGGLSLSTGDLDNTAGLIGAQGTLVAHGANIVNAGQILAQSTVDLTAANLDNRGGSLQAADNLSITLGSGVLDNSGGLVRSNKTLTVGAQRITNSRTQGSDQGLEGDSVGLNANQLQNDDGAIRANQAIDIHSAGALDNTRGQISAQTLNIIDPAALQANKTLAITNTGGTLLAGQDLTLDAASLSGDGNVYALRNLNLWLNRDFSNSGQIIANTNLDFRSTGKLTNSGTMKAGDTLTLNADSADNQGSGEISAWNTWLTTTGSLSNRGLIDGSDTRLTALTLSNRGSGRIYGDTLSISANTLNNDVESGTAAVIAARSRLDLGVGTLSNREHALIYSEGDLSIGGVLDGNRQATGQAGTITNSSATIEAQGNLSINAATLNNTNAHYSTQEVLVSSTAIDEHQGEGSPYRYTDAYTQDVRDDFYRWVINGIKYDRSYEYQYTRTVTETRELSSDPAKLLAGGSITLNIGTATNDKSQIIAGGAINVTGGNLINTTVSGQRVTTDSGTVLHYIDHQPGGSGNDWTEVQSAAYNPAPMIENIAITPTVFLANTAAATSTTTINNLNVGQVSLIVATTGSISGNTTPSAPTTQTTAPTAPTTQNGSTAPVVIGNPSITLPNNALYHQNPSPTARYLIETDPRFASYGNWLSSDYMLQQLSIDPSYAQKRLGDGFYEQKLLREQIAQLTGRRFLAGYASDEAEFRALMNNGVSVAKAWNLIPGVALSAAQVAQLTSDIVWLVEKDVTLSDGTHQKVLVPQIYLMPQAGDLAVSGALISGATVNANLTGDFVNSGTVAGRSIVTLTAENIRNLGGRINGADIGLSARTDLDNIGGRIEAGNSLTAVAGRDINVVSTTRTQSTGQGSRTNIDRVAGLYVTGGEGVLLATAGRDVNLVGAAILNTATPVAATTTSEGVTTAATTPTTTFSAGRDLNLATVIEAQRHDLAWDRRNYRNESSRTEVGTTIQTQGDIRLAAGNDLNARAASVTSDQGAIVATAGRDIKLTAGEAQVKRDEASYSRSRGSWGSKKTVTTHDTLDQTTAIGSSLSGNSITIQADRDIALKGANVVGTQDTTLVAKNNLTIAAATNTTLESHFKQEKKSGIFSSGGVGITIGTQQMSTDQQGKTTTSVASTVGSIDGNVTLLAGQTYTQIGSQVLAPKGDIDIAAKKVDILEARETSESRTDTKFKQSGLTLAITSPVISAIQTAKQMSQAISNTSGSSSQSRMQLLGAANTAMAANNAYDAIKAGQGSTIDGKPNQIQTGVGSDGKAITRDTTAAEQAGGVNISISVGTSRSQSTTTQSSNTAVGSTIAAGNNVRISATGAGRDSDLTIQGSSVTAGNNIALSADDQIKLLAAYNDAEQHSTNKSASGSIGISVGTGGFGVTVGASMGRGHADGNDVSWTNSNLAAGNTLTLTSGGDTTLKGATASGKQVIADVGGNLSIESLQDTSHYDSKQQSIGGSITIGAGVSGSLSASQSKVNSDYASVTEQSGILAGDDGFQVKVKGNTDLKGAVIASSQTAVEQNANRFETGGTLTLSDIQNKADYQGSSMGVNIGTSVSSQGALTPSGTSAGLGKEQGSANSTTVAGISGIAGNTKTRTGDAQTGIGKIFDADKVQKSIDAQVQITQTFGQLAPKAAAGFAETQANALKNQAKLAAEAGDTAGANEYLSEAARWGEGGVYRVALHTVIGGLGGGVQGAVGAGTVASAAPLLSELQESVTESLKKAGLSDTAAKAAGQLIAQGTAAGIGAVSSGGSTAGAVMAFDVDTNNRQLHPNQLKILGDLAKKTGKNEGDYTAVLCVLQNCDINGLSGYDKNGQMIYQAGRDLLASNPELFKQLAAEIGNSGVLSGQFAYQLGSGDFMKDATGKYLNDKYDSLRNAYALFTSSPEDIASAVKGGVKGLASNVKDVPPYPLDNADEQRGALWANAALVVAPVAKNVTGATLTALGDAWEVSKILGAGEVVMSGKGTISAQQITRSGMPAALNAEDLSKLATLDSLSTFEAGALRESVADSYFKRNGFTALDGKCGSNCFDGVFVKGDQVVINEVKPLNSNNTIQLSGENTKTGLPTQMTNEWIDSRMTELRNSGDPVKMATAQAIQKAIDNGTLVKVVSGVNSNGMTMVKVNVK